MTDRNVSIVLVTFGEHSERLARAVGSLHFNGSLPVPIHLACNAACAETLALARGLYGQGKFATLIESSHNHNKCPMVRTMLNLVRTPYVVVMDDDSHVRPGWLESLESFLAKHPDVDVAGKLYTHPRSPEYQRVAERRPWWRGHKYIPDAMRSRITFATGAFYLARVDFLRRHDFPDRDMVMQFEDVLLSDCAHQWGGRLLSFPQDLLDRVVINDGPRRWEWPAGRNDAASPPPPEQADRPAFSTARIGLPSIEQLLREGIALWKQSRYADAEQACNRILEREPGHHPALHLLALSLHRTGRDEHALALLDRAIAADPAIPDYHNNRGNVLARLSRYDHAADAYRDALRARPDHAEARRNLASVLERLGRFDEAIDLHRRNVEEAPEHAAAHFSLCRCLRAANRSHEALAAAERLVRLRPDGAEAHNNLGLSLHDLLRVDDARAAFDRALALDPTNDSTRFNRALLDLAAGNWADGWAGYEARFAIAEHRGDRFERRAPRYAGEPLAGRTIVVHCEQGLGTTIQFIRLVPALVDRGARVIVECQPRLTSLLASAGYDCAILPRGEELPPHGFHLPLLSLPAVLGLTPETIPADVPYLHADPARVARWSDELAALPGLRVGISWQGNPKFAADRHRSIPLPHFAPLADVPGVSLVSLQKDAGHEQLAAAPFPIAADLGPRLDADPAADNFLDAAGVIACLDLVVTSDTAIAHLAGALGIPAWVALAFNADWRWLLHRTDTPWYPTMRLFRQPAAGDWPAIFADIADSLRRLAMDDGRLATANPIRYASAQPL